MCVFHWVLLRTKMAKSNSDAGEMFFFYILKTEWLASKQMDTQFETIPDEQLASLLREFFAAARSKKEKRYSKSGIIFMVVSTGIYNSCLTIELLTLRNQEF